MSTTSEYLQQLQTDKQNLVDNLVTKGVSATSDETFTSLVPKVLDIQSGGSDVEITDCFYLFYGNHRLDSLEDLLKLCKQPTDCSYMFYNSSNLTSVDLSNLDTSNCTNFRNMFDRCTNLTTVNLKNVDVSKAQYLIEMFSQCSSLQSIDVSGFDTSNITHASNMFNGCSSLESIDLSNWDASKITSNNNMFMGCSNLFKVVINREAVFPMSNTGMFQNTPIYNDWQDGTIYVPDNMVETYKTATNWSAYADRIKPISELPAEEA